mgnify:CR=1 FL=1
MTKLLLKVIFKGRKFLYKKEDKDKEIKLLLKSDFIATITIIMKYWKS